MKKLSITLFTLIWISLFGFSTASAGGLGFGVTASYMNVEAAGTETDSLDWVLPPPLQLVQGLLIFSPSPLHSGQVCCIVKNPWLDLTLP